MCSSDVGVDVEDERLGLASSLKRFDSYSFPVVRGESDELGRG